MQFASLIFAACIPSTAALHSLFDAYRSILEINVLPTQSEYFTTPQSQGEADSEQSFKAFAI